MELCKGVIRESTCHNLFAFCYSNLPLSTGHKLLGGVETWRVSMKHGPYRVPVVELLLCGSGTGPSYQSCLATPISHNSAHGTSTNATAQPSSHINKSADA